VSASEPVPEGDVDFDVVVLGAGTGGCSAAFRAADLGLRVALINHSSTLGGVCLNVGCIPSKTLLHAARVVEEAREMGPHGIEFGAPRIDTARLRAWKDQVIGKLTGGLASMARLRKVEVIVGTARFASPHVLEVEQDGGTRRVGFKRCIIAAGSKPVRLPGWPESSWIMDSTSALELEAVPARLLVVGGGIIGLEMATVYAALGSKVSVVELTDALLPGCDSDLVRPLAKRIAERYEAIMLATRVESATLESDGVSVHFSGDAAPAEPQRYDRVLVAVGRRANGGTIGAEKAGVDVNDRGLIEVDKQMRTNVSHIFAIGDIVGQPMLAHKASHEGKVAAEVCAGQKSHFDARVVPSVAYTDPEVAWVGFTETEARGAGIAYQKGVFPWSASGRSLSLGRSDGFTKLLFAEETKRLIGAGIVGTNAGDLISEIALAIEMGCDAEDIGLTVHPHPTLSETVAFAAEVVAGTVTDLYIPKR
jgi:dihydrolipoyl dehydrogenase